MKSSCDLIELYDYINMISYVMDNILNIRYFQNTITKNRELLFVWIHVEFKTTLNVELYFDSRSIKFEIHENFERILLQAF